jgi:hypothetical protein
MKMTHHYLVDTSTVIPGAAVSTLQFNIIKEEPFTVHNLEVCNVKYYNFKRLEGTPHFISVSVELVRA